ncbi:Aerotolerance-related protein BatC [Constantimarinum furrinae]|uniref:Aerotolerance-related protein BatC n=2 Tax=Constantimarinum furrinae TaxID=2562285 RepID=A0A7G8PTE1_9FLAO|nr:Aerotolerance-related protein BatC [Constantimarinum furrinae]
MRVFSFNFFGNMLRSMNGAYILVVSLFLTGAVFGQTDREKRKLMNETNQLLADASEDLNENNFPQAEADYRKAVAIDPLGETARYNLGNAYYNKTMNEEAIRRFGQAANAATGKPEKHKAFHNLGNAYMNTKNYQAAVEAYKNALRNNPTDEETRYNLALAKDLLEKNPPQGGGDDNKDDENKDNKDKENEDDKGENDDGKDGDDKKEEDKGEEKDENKEGDNKEDKGNPDKPNEQKEGDKPQQQQPVPGKLSPQQVKNLLEAMNNEEKKVQDKINAQKQKGAKVKSNKDW